MAANESCFYCKETFLDVKSVIQCNGCSYFYHGKCMGVELRGFHMKKSTWKCFNCAPNVNSESEVMSHGGETRARKRSRCEENEYISITEIIETLNTILESNKVMNNKIDELITENKNLKLEISQLKNTRINESAQISNTISYASVASSTKQSVLIVKPKDAAHNIVKTKEDLRQKIQPSEMNTGITMGRKIRNGGLVLNCEQNNQIDDIKTQIQTKMGAEYEIIKPSPKKNRIKVFGIHENEHNSDEQTIVTKIIRQNDLEVGTAEVKLLRKSNIVNKKFNLILELDEISFKKVAKKEKMFIGWNRCYIKNDFNIVRCYNCCKYGHIKKNCQNEVCCPLCSEKHTEDKCTKQTKKCINCVTANQSYNLQLNVDHYVWSKDCKTLNRIMENQKKKYVNSEITK